MSKNILVVPDSFKESLSSKELVALISESIKYSSPNSVVNSFCFSDGGEGFVESYSASGVFEKVLVHAVNAYGLPINAFYSIDKKERVAIIEAASASGLVLTNVNERNLFNASSFGTGVLIKDALEKGVEKIILGLGGSATNDGGLGLLNALGYHFFSQSNKEIKTVLDLGLVAKLEMPTKCVFSDAEIILACDVENVLCGESGATFVYGPQKGGGEDELPKLDLTLRVFGRFLEILSGEKILDKKGSGAAGGMGIGLIAFAGAEIKSGFQILSQKYSLSDKVKGTDLLITGEGKFDDQSQNGKIVGELINLAKLHNKKVLVVAGDSDVENISPNVEILTLVNDEVSKEEAMINASFWVQQRIKEYFKR